MDLNLLGRREIVSILFKRAKLLLGIFVITFAVIFGGSYLLTSKYKAEGQFLVQSGREFQVVPNKGDSLPSVPYMTKQEVVNSEVAILESRDLAESTIQAVGLKRIYPDIADKDASELIRMNDAIKRFAKNLRAEPVTMSNVIILRYWNPNRDTAIQTLQKFDELYQRKHVEIFGNKQSNFLEQQTQDYEKQLEKITRQISDLKTSQHLSDIVYEREQLIQDRSDVEGKLRSLKEQSIDAHQARDYYAPLLTSMPELVLTIQNSADAIETAKSKLLDLNSHLLDVEQRYPDNNADAIALRQDLKKQIAQIHAFIKDPKVNQQNQLGRNLAYDQARLKLQIADATIPSVDQQIAFLTGENNRIIARLQGLDDGEANLEVLNREHDILQELVHTYRTRYEEARIDEDLDRQRMISVSIVQAPASDAKPDKPNHLLFAAAGIAMGLLSMGMAIVYFLVFRESVITVESLARTLNIRVVEPFQTSRDARSVGGGAGALQGF